MRILASIIHPLAGIALQRILYCNTVNLLWRGEIDADLNLFARLHIARERDLSRAAQVCTPGWRKFWQVNRL